MSNTTVVKKQFTTTINGHEVETSISFDWSHVPNTSILVLATRALIIDLQRIWRKKYAGNPAQLKDDLDGTVFDVKKYLTERPIVERQKRSKLDKAVASLLALGVGEAEIITITTGKGYDEDAVKASIARATSNGNTESKNKSDKSGK